MGLHGSALLVSIFVCMVSGGCAASEAASLVTSDVAAIGRFLLCVAGSKKTEGGLDQGRLDKIVHAIAPSGRAAYLSLFSSGVLLCTQEGEVVCGKTFLLRPADCSWEKIRILPQLAPLKKAAYADVVAFLDCVKSEPECVSAEDDFLMADMRLNAEMFKEYSVEGVPWNEGCLQAHVGVAELSGRRAFNRVREGKARTAMEDVVAVQRLSGRSFFAVFDGHGDEKQCGFACARGILPLLGVVLDGSAPSDIMERAQKVCHALIAFNWRLRSPAGSSPVARRGCTMAAFLYEHATGAFYMINLGDSRAIGIGRNGSCCIATRDQCFCAEEEVRIQDAGGLVVGRKIAGYLSVYRSFGYDVAHRYGDEVAGYRHTGIFPVAVGMRPQIIGGRVMLDREDPPSACVEYNSELQDSGYYSVDTIDEVEAEEFADDVFVPRRARTDYVKASAFPESVEEPFLLPAGVEYVIVACDGLWDVMENAAVAAFVHQKASRGLTMQQISEALVREAYNRGSKDNISCVVINVSDLITCE